MIPKGNEKEIRSIASKLKISNPCFCYPYQDYKKKKQLLSPYKEILVGILSSSPNEIRKAKQKNIFVITPSNNRKVLESFPDLVFEVEMNTFKDGLHSRNSGLNHVLCNIMKGKSTLGISISSLISSPLPQTILGRMRQNTKIARKQSLNLCCFSFARHPYEVRSSIDRKHFLSSQL